MSTRSYLVNAANDLEAQLGRKVIGATVPLPMYTMLCYELWIFPIPDSFEYWGMMVTWTVEPVLLFRLTQT